MGEGMGRGLGQEKQPVPPSRRLTLLLALGCSETAAQVGSEWGWVWRGALVWGGTRPTTHACIVVVAVWKLKRFSLGNQVRMGVSSGKEEQ